MKILITGGGCKEYIDSVRVVTNSSTGRTSAVLADELYKKGNDITLISAKSAIKPENPQINVKLFETGAELTKQIRKELTSQKYDAVIHAAAVSDFVPDTITIAGQTVKAGKNAVKIHSGSPMTVTFRPSSKIADNLHEWAKAGGADVTKVVCFKLTNKADETEKNRAVSKLFSRSKADFVVYNDLSQISENSHPFVVLNKNGNQIGNGKSNLELAEVLFGALRGVPVERVATNELGAEGKAFPSPKEFL